MGRGLVLALVAFVGFGTGCVSARMSDHVSNRLFREGRYEEAAKKLDEGVLAQGENGRDLLLFLLDEGLALHAAGKYEESNKLFLRADKIAEIKDYTSLAAEGATLLTSENAKDYKGEDFEKVLINTYLAMNYALMGDTENALVEARRVNHKLQRMITEGQRKYQQNAFARYLSAILYESEGNFNDAYVDYKFTRDLEPSLDGLGRDLWRMAFFLGMSDEMERWDKEYRLTEQDHAEARRLKAREGNAEIIVLYENGISPIKQPHPSWHSLPRFYPRFNPILYAEVDVDGKTAASTRLLHNIESTAIANLDDKYAGLVARRVAGVVTKEVVASQIEKRTSSPLLGFLTRVALYVSDQADLRSWNLLPRDLQIARIITTPGTHTIRVRPGGGAVLPERTVQVAKGKKVFVNFRYMP